MPWFAQRRSGALPRMLAMLMLTRSDWTSSAPPMPPQEPEHYKVVRAGLSQTINDVGDSLGARIDAVGYAAANAMQSAGGSPATVAKTDGVAAGAAAAASGKSLQDVGKAAADADRAAGGSPSIAAEAAGLAASITAAANGKSPAELGHAAAYATQSAEGSPPTVAETDEAAVGAAAAAGGKSWER